MNRQPIHWVTLLAAALFAPALASAQNLTEQTTNRLTFSARFGLNISAKFTGTAPIAVPPSTRTTPNGQPYNYSDGYVYPDVSGSADGQTWYWGYDNSASQVNAANNTILLHRSTGQTVLAAPSEDDGMSPGAELAYARQLGSIGDVRWGLETAANYVGISVAGHVPYALRGGQATDAYAYTPGTTPPAATPGSPYQGTFDGPGFTIGSTPVSSATTEGTVGTVTGSRHLDANLWGGHLGPYFEFDPAPGITLSFSGGLAVGWIDASASWNETATFTSGGSLTDSGSGTDNAWLWGGYVSANAYWRLNDHLSAATGVQYLNLGTYDHSFGARRVELDLRKSVLLTLGLSYNF
jgi:hypothetical protein